MDIAGFRAFVDAVEWRWAKSYAEKAPHWYAMRVKNTHVWKDFEAAALFIRKFGAEDRYYSKRYMAFWLDGYKYWTMDAEAANTTLVNRTSFAYSQEFACINWTPQAGYRPGPDYTFEGEVTELEIATGEVSLDDGYYEEPWL